MDTFDFENDPITSEQVSSLRQLLAEEWSDKARDGFLVISGRFIDETSNDRTHELTRLFCTDTAVGRRVLRASLEALFDHVGSLAKFEQDYPVYINDPVHGSVGLFPQLPILGIHRIHPVLYRLFDTNAKVRKSPIEETVSKYITRTSRLPMVNIFSSWVLREKPYIYWCSYESFATPTEARAALQILDSWGSDCKMRATLGTEGLDGNAFVAYSGVSKYPEGVVNLSKDGDIFAGYNVELAASDHPELPGGGMQVAVVGEPEVLRLEEWSDIQNEWVTLWKKVSP